MEQFLQRFRSYIETHPLDTGDEDCPTVLDQLYQAYAESHESDPLEIQAGFAELEAFLEALPLSDNNAVFSICCRLCNHYERKAFIDGVQYGAQLLLELNKST
ncbi:MAG: hypothetical protein E7448_02640 [Ruminococcaceae bacterium]|nr:hypothetical protein [Oscillospiraceae bacterium]